MVAFSKFLTGQRGSQQLLDTDGYTYVRRKDKDTLSAAAWRCTKNRSLKCTCHVWLTPEDNTLTRGAKPHTHEPEPLVEEKRELLTSLKRKAEDQQLSCTQNILTEALATSSAELNVLLPKLESLARVAQRARAKTSGSANHPEAPTSAEFELPPSCQTTIRGDDFVAYDGKTDKGSRLIVFATKRNLLTLTLGGGGGQLSELV